MQDIAVKDLLLSQIDAILQENKVQESLIKELRFYLISQPLAASQIASQVVVFLQVNNVKQDIIGRILTLRGGVGRVMGMSYADIPTPSTSYQHIAVVSNNLTGNTLQFVFPPNKEEFIPRLQRAQNYRLRVAYMHQMGNLEYPFDIPILRSIWIDSYYVIYPRAPEAQTGFNS